MNLLKTFEIIKHDLLLVKLKSYGFSENKNFKTDVELPKRSTTSSSNKQQFQVM